MVWQERTVFEVQHEREGARFRRFATGLAILNLISLILTAWIMIDVRREQQVLARIIEHIPARDLKVAQELSGDLQLHRGLGVLLALNLIATAIAFIFLVRGYLSSQRSLRDVKVLAADILASMDAGVITTDRHGMITSINPSGKKLIGLADTGLGQSLARLAPEHRLLESICSEVRVHQQSIRDRDYSVLADGQKRTLRAGCTLLRNQRQQDIGAVLHVRDVTEKTLIEERLRRMERYMGLGSLAAGLQHEIKNPLSALSLHIQLLCERLAQESPAADVTEMLDVLHTEVKRINGVLDGFRNYASITKLGRAPVDVTLLIEKLVRLLRPQAESQQVKIQVDSPREMVGLIQADSVGLEQVLLNLALNAMASMPHGGCLGFRTGRQNDAVLVDVSDTGKGIPAEIQPKIFDPYFTTRSDGTGMGLALCDKIIRQHDGSIEFRTGPGGTVFTVSLPLEIPS